MTTSEYPCEHGMLSLGEQLGAHILAVAGGVDDGAMRRREAAVVAAGFVQERLVGQVPEATVAAAVLRRPLTPAVRRCAELQARGACLAGCHNSRKPELNN